MTAIKERIIGAITVMSDSDAEKFWKIIQEKFSLSWENIKEEEPDEFDLLMLKAIEEEPECREFINENDIDWDE